MSAISYSERMDFTSEASVIKTRFIEITGKSPCTYTDLSASIAYYIDVILHGKLYERFTTSPIADLMSELKIPTDYADYIVNDARDLIREKLLRNIPKDLKCCLLNNSVGLAASATKITEYGFGIDLVFNERELLCQNTPVNKNYL